MPCAPGAFSLTAPVFRSPRAQKGAWCAPHGSDGRRGHRRQEQARVQAVGTGGEDRQWETMGDDGAGQGASGDRQEGTTVQEGASGEMQEGDDGAGRCKWGEAGRERWRGTRSGRTRKEAD